MAKTIERLKRDGWYEYNTGGGCMALRVDLAGEQGSNDYMYALITNDDGEGIPKGENEAVLLGIYRTSSGDEMEPVIESYPTIHDALVDIVGCPEGEEV